MSDCRSKLAVRQRTQIVESALMHDLINLQQL
ncbi:hypothetical protein [Synechococcus sp. MIT S9503]